MSTETDYKKLYRKIKQENVRLHNDNESLNAMNQILQAQIVADSNKEGKKNAKV